MGDQLGIRCAVAFCLFLFFIFYLVVFCYFNPLRAILLCYRSFYFVAGLFYSVASYLNLLCGLVSNFILFFRIRVFFCIHIGDKS